MSRNKSNRNSEQRSKASNGNSRGRHAQRGTQGRKDSKSPRINCDNEREAKFVKQFEKD